MRNLKVETGPVVLGYRSTPTSTGSGGTVTWSIAVDQIDMGHFGDGSISGPQWHSRVDMNLMKFEMSGFWTYITAENPVYVTLVRDSNTWDVLAEIVLTASSGNYETWTGSVPILAGDSIQCYIYGAEVEIFSGDTSFYTWPLAEELCVTAWFDGEAGGGLLLYPNFSE